MGILSSIKYSFRNDNRISLKSYANTDPDFEKISVSELKKRYSGSYSLKKALKHELSGLENVFEAIILSSKKSHITQIQVKEILNDLGFNVDPLMSKTHNSDFSAVLNINGNFIPGWNLFFNYFLKKHERLLKMFLFMLAPGKSRLHLRIFEMEDGTWMILSHTDPNWISPNPFEIAKGHLGSGEGDFETGTELMMRLLMVFISKLNDRKTVSASTINSTVSSFFSQRYILSLKTSDIT